MVLVVLVELVVLLLLLMLVLQGAPMTGTNASADPLFVGGKAVYSAYFEGVRVAVAEC